MKRLTKEEAPPRPPGVPETWHWSYGLKRYCAGPSDEELESLPLRGPRCLTMAIRENDRRRSEGLPELNLNSLYSPSPDES